MNSILREKVSEGSGRVGGAKVNVPRLLKITEGSDGEGCMDRMLNGVEGASSFHHMSHHFYPPLYAFALKTSQRLKVYEI